MANSMSMMLAMFAFMLMAIVGMLNPEIPLPKLITRALGGLVVFWVLGKIYSNIGRDLFREAIADAKARREEQAERTRALLDDGDDLDLDLSPEQDNKNEG